MLESSKVVLTFESVDEILKCDHSNKSYQAVLSCGTIYYFVQGGSNFWVCGWNPKVWPFKWKHWAVLSCGTVYYNLLYKVVLTFESVDESLKCDHSSESCLAVLSCGAVYYFVQGGSNFWVCGWNPKVWSFKWKLLYSGPFLWYCLLCCTRWF